MMNNLLKINTVTFPEAEGGYDLSYSDKVNGYESESGEKTVEIIRRNVVSISVSYNGLLEQKLRELCAAIQTVNTVTFYDPLAGNVVTKTMQADTNRISISKVHYKDDLSIWSLSFSLEEM